MGRNGTEYRVCWKRQGQPSKARRYATLAGVQRFAQLFGPEPWRAFGKQPDAYRCCSGRECGCEGVTMRQYHEAMGAELPVLEWAHMEMRYVGPWERNDMPVPIAGLPEGR